MDHHAWRGSESSRGRGTCLNCEGNLGPSGTKFCSNACQRDYGYKTYITRWLANEETGGRGDNVSTYIRRWFFEKTDGRCEHCGWCRVNPVTGKVPLTINHVDGNHENNRPENLELICPSCHSLTPNYGALNRGKGRTKRKMMARARSAVLGNGGDDENRTHPADTLQGYPSDPATSPIH